MLYVIAGLDEPHGLAIKEELEGYYESEVNHGRLYPNLDTLVEKGLRDDVIVMVGGAPLNEDFGQAIGADAYCRDAGVAVDMAKSLIAQRRAA